MRLAAAAVLAFVAVAPPAWAADAPKDFSKKAVSVYGAADDPITQRMRAALLETGRFSWVDVPGAPSAVADHVRAVAGVRGMAGAAYVMAPSLAFGTITSTNPRIDKNENRDGTWSATAYAHLEVPYTIAVDLFESAGGKKLETITYTDVLQRRFEYRYDDRTSVEAIQYKAHELARVMAREAGRAPAEAFVDQAARAKLGLVDGFVGKLKAHKLFRLEVQLSGWSDVKERIYFNLGKDVRVRIDDGFKLMKGDRQIGYLKVRDLDAGLSGAQPLWLEETLAATDRVIEAPKAQWNHGLRLGYGWLGGSVATFGYAGEVNVGPAWFGASERYLTFDAAFATNFLSGGGNFNLGYVQKLFHRRYALRLGGKAGVMAGLAGDFPLPGAALVTGLDFHFNEHVTWGTDVDLAAYWPYVSLRGPNAGQTVYTFGPLVRTGLTALF